MSDKQLKAFKDDLAKLLEKHGAVMGVTVEGDTHGIYGENIDVCFNTGEKSRHGFAIWSDNYLLIPDNGNSLSAKELK